MRLIINYFKYNYNISPPPHCHTYASPALAYSPLLGVPLLGAGLPLLGVRNGRACNKYVTGP